MKISLFGQQCLGQLPIQCSFISHIFSIIFYRQKRSKNFKVLLQEGEHLLEICRQMNKGIRFNISQNLRTILHRTMTYPILVYFVYVLFYLPRREKNSKILSFWFRKKNTMSNFLLNKERNLF